MRVGEYLRVEHAQTCEDDRSLGIVNGLDGKVFDILDKFGEKLIDVVEDKVAFSSDD